MDSLPTTKDGWCALHDKNMESWIKGGEVIHVWRNYEDGYLVSYYIIMFRRDRQVSLDFARVFGNSKTPSIDQRTDFPIKDDVVREAAHTHPYRGIGSTW
jgi:hypothetical protein